jgi:hypothetical protein
VAKDWFAAKSRQHDRGDKNVQWFCPNGHETVFSREAESVALRRERDILKQQIARYEQFALEKEREVAAAKAELKREHRRAVAGVCPCCNRTFRQLATHMRHMHPAEVRANQAQAKGGKARSAILPPETRRDIARRAARARWQPEGSNAD